MAFKLSKFTSSSCFFIFMLGFSCSGSVLSDTWSFTKIADTNTTIPGTTVMFNSFAVPSIDGDNIAFWGGDEGGTGHAAKQGILSNIGGSLQFIAQRYVTIIPGAPLVNDEAQTFTRFGGGSTSISNGQVAFFGQNIYTLVNSGIYKGGSGALTRIADQQVSIPSGTGQFNVNSFTDYNQAIHEGMVTFIGGDATYGGMATQQGVYRGLNDSSLEKIADYNTVIPDGVGSYTDNFISPRIDSTGIAFIGGNSNQRGIYKYHAGQLIRIVDNTMQTPGSNMTFLGFRNLSVDSGDIVFLGRDSSSFNGVYSVIGGDLTVVADESMQFPGSVYSYSSFRGASIDQGNVVFNADAGSYANPLMGIFADFGGGIESVITVLDVLDGKTPTAFNLSPDGLSGNKIVFGVTFTDGSRGIYQANRTTPMDPVWGDINGDLDVNAIDVLLATQEVTGLTTLSLEQRARGNVAPLINGTPQPVDPHEALDVADFLLITQKALGTKIF